MSDRRGIAFCVGVFLAARLGLSVAGWVGVHPAELPGGVGAEPGVEAITARSTGREVPATPGVHNVVDATLRWDAFWYVLIADEGYVSEPTAAFFPGYPLGIRIVDQLTPFGGVGSALLVSNAAFLAALIALYRLTRAEYDDSVARRSILLLTFFPTSFFFLAPYGESLYLLCAVLALSWARTDHWARAGIAGAVGWAVRSAGGILGPALFLEAWDRRRLPPLGWAFTPALGLASYLAWWWIRSGDPFVPFTAQSSWFREPAFAPVTVGKGIAIGLRAITDPLWLPEAGDAVLGLMPLVVLAFGWRRLPARSYAVYAALGFLLPLSFAVPARPLLSLPRFVIVLFPVAWIGALWLQRRWWFRGVLAASVGGWIALSVGFMNWHFVA